MQAFSSSECAVLRLFVLISTVALAIPSAAQQEKILYSFGNGTVVTTPNGALTIDPSGNLYGTTFKGGAYGYGTVFELSPNVDGTWTQKVLHDFNDNGVDGANPVGSLLLDASGNLYGATQYGGSGSLTASQRASFNGGTGTAFELSPANDGSWTETILHRFQGQVRRPGGREYPTDGYYPTGSLTFDAAGNLYGTTLGGGTRITRSDAGTVYELSPSGSGEWAEKVLYNFFSGFESTGASPNPGLIMDAAGNLYGTTAAGGSRECHQQGCGTVFELTQTANGWTESGSYSFNNIGTQKLNGVGPNGGLIADSVGNLYGTTVAGGSEGCSEQGCGTVFELQPSQSWSETVLLGFNNDGADGLNGVNPYAGLAFDSVGNLYGTTVLGGANGCDPGACGVVFELSPTAEGWVETALHTFQNNGIDGTSPQSAVIIDSDGNLYGTTTSGGAYGNGTVYEITP